MPIPKSLDLQKTMTQRMESALALGALQPVDTETVIVPDGEISFLVHILTHLRDKSLTTSKQRAEGVNPFLPPDPDLLIARISPTHLCVFNKFNVIDRHLLVITEEFEDQNEFLTLSDFEALCACMAELGGLGFYNAGRIAGASQPHKHIQLVPTPLGAQAEPTPVDRMMAQLPADADRCQGLSFTHRLRLIEESPVSTRSAQSWLNLYRDLLAEAGIGNTAQPYNLLVTSRWMMLVPRSHEVVDGISINALGFAGSLLVRDRIQLEMIRRMGPMNILESVAGAYGGPK